MPPNQSLHLPKKPAPPPDGGALTTPQLYGSSGPPGTAFRPTGGASVGPDDSGAWPRAEYPVRTTLESAEEEVSGIATGMPRVATGRSASADLAAAGAARRVEDFQRISSPRTAAAQMTSDRPPAQRAF